MNEVINEEYSRRRRRSADPYFALWSLCSTVVERDGALAAAVIDDFENVLASTGDSELAGIATLSSRIIASDLRLSKRVSLQARSHGRTERVAVVRRYTLVDPRRDLFQLLLVVPDGMQSDDIAENAVAAMKRILARETA